MNPNDTFDIEQQLERHKQIQAEAPLRHKSQAMFFEALDQYEIKTRKLAPPPAVKMFAFFPLRPVIGLACTALLAFVLVFQLTQTKYSLAETLAALKTVTTMRYEITTTHSGDDEKSWTRQAVFQWEKDGALRVDEEITGDDWDTHEQKTWWITKKDYTIIDHLSDMAVRGKMTPNRNQLLDKKLSELERTKALPEHDISSAIKQNSDIEVTTIQRDNQTLIQYQLRQSHQNNVREDTFIIDAATKLPVESRYTIESSRNSYRETTVVRYEWNQALEANWDQPGLTDDMDVITIEGRDWTEIPAIAYPGGFLTGIDHIRYDMNPAADPPITHATVKGTVIDEDGKPVPNAAIELFSYSSDSEYGAHTDADGSFAFQMPINLTQSNYPLSPVRYPEYVRIRCAADGYKTAYHNIIVDQYSPAAELDFVIKHGASVSGVVLDAQNNPAADISITTHHRKKLIGSENYMPIRTTTDENGTFTLTGLGTDQSTYELTLEGRGFVPQTLIARYNHETKRFELEASAITLKAIDFANAAAAFERTIQVRDKNGKAIEGATVYHKRKDVYEQSEPMQTDMFGEVRITSYTTPNYEVFVWKDGYGAEFTEVDLSEEASKQIVLGDEARMQGMVVDDLGQPVAGLQPQVTAYGPNWDSFIQFGEFFDLTDEDGLFEISGLNPNLHYDIHISVQRDLEYFDPGYSNHQLLAGKEFQEEPFTFHVVRAVPVEGRIVFADTQEPVPYFRVAAKGHFDMKVYDSTSGYFKARARVATLDGSPSVLDINVFMGDGFFGTRSINDLVATDSVARKYITTDELDHDLVIEVPRGE